jgi:hypothetical protein
MEDGMAVDVVLWFILAVTMGFLFCGCICTAPGKKAAKLHDGTPDRKFDRAA